MANVPTQGGLSPVRMAGGSVYTCSAVPMYGTGPLAPGDVVVVSGSANASKITSGYAYGAIGSGTGTLRTCVKATNGTNNPVTGVVVRVALNLSSPPTGPNVLPTGNSGVVYVETNPEVVYALQSDGAGGAHTVADVGSNANLTGSTYDTATGQSVVKLDSTSVGADATKQLTIVGLSQYPGQNDLASSGVVFYVRLNNTTEAPNKAGV